MGGSSNTKPTYGHMESCINGGELLGDLIFSGKFNVCQGNAYS